MGVQLGTKYKDTISGFEGVATGRYDYHNGCQRVTLSGSDKDGCPKDYTFDVQQLVDVETGKAADDVLTKAAKKLVKGFNEAAEAAAATLKTKKAARVGGPRSTPSRSGH